MYRPNFCAECGTKVLRLRWRIWNSRRFCKDCARRFRKARVMGPLLASMALIISGYVGKVLYEALATPLTYLVVNKLKRAEGVDVYDRGTNFNPFASSRGEAL